LIGEGTNHEGALAKPLEEKGAKKEEKKRTRKFDSLSKVDFNFDEFVVYPCGEASYANKSRTEVLTTNYYPIRTNDMEY
jgi:hypothetical protein